MAKRKKTIISGPIVETVIYTAPEPRDGPRERAEKSRMTTAAQKAVNDNCARRKLSRLISTNFTWKDLFATLTYRDGSLPVDRKEARKLLAAFLRKLRDARRRRGAELKYIYVTEDKHGDGRIHHHVILNATGEDMEELRSLWTYGDIVDVEYIGKHDFDGWAVYMSKEAGDRPNGARMWTPSKNLKKPIVNYEYVTSDTTLTFPPGVEPLDRREEVGMYGSFCYIKYRLRDPDGGGGLQLHLDN